MLGVFAHRAVGGEARWSTAPCSPASGPPRPWECPFRRGHKTQGSPPVRATRRARRPRQRPKRDRRRVGFRRVPTRHVDSVGHVSDRHIVRWPAWEKRLKEAPTDFPMQATHAVNCSAASDCQIGHGSTERQALLNFLTTPFPPIHRRWLVDVTTETVELLHSLRNNTHRSNRTGAEGVRHRAPTAECPYQVRWRVSSSPDSCVLCRFGLAVRTNFSEGVPTVPGRDFSRSKIRM